MITEKEILIQINKMLVEKYPENTVYINFCPQKFARPSFFIEHVTTDHTDVNCKIIKLTVYCTITCFATIDKRYNSDADNIMDLQTNILNIFRSGYMAVGDRAIKVKSSMGGTTASEAYIDIQFEFNDDREEETGGLPLIQTVNANTTIKEG